MDKITIINKKQLDHAQNMVNAYGIQHKLNYKTAKTYGRQVTFTDYNGRQYTLATDINGNLYRRINKNDAYVFEDDAKLWVRL